MLSYKFLLTKQVSFPTHSTKLLILLLLKILYNICIHFMSKSFYTNKNGMIPIRNNAVCKNGFQEKKYLAGNFQLHWLSWFWQYLSLHENTEQPKNQMKQKRSQSYRSHIHSINAWNIAYLKSYQAFCF